MNFLQGIQNFLKIINENWTTIIVIIGLAIGTVNRIKKYINLTDDEKIEIAKTQISETILKLISDAESDYSEWKKAGSIKRSQVIEDIFIKYPILSKVADQTEIVKWIDDEIDNALETLREIIEENKRERHIRGGMATKHKYEELSKLKK